MKSYEQQCPIAMALDVIGDRWSLLVVRELMLGPLRFGEIADGLPGVGSRQLTERLKALVEQGVIEAARVPSANEVAGYALTAHGRGLAPSLSALAAWGLSLWLAAPHGAASPTSVALMLWARAARQGAALRTLAEVSLDGRRFSYEFSDDGVRAWRGEPGAVPDVRLAVSLQDALALLAGRLERTPLTQLGRLTLEGEGAEALARALLDPPDA